MRNFFFFAVVFISLLSLDLKAAASNETADTSKPSRKGAYMEAMGSLAYRYDRLLIDLKYLVGVLAHNASSTMAHDTISYQHLCWSAGADIGYRFSRYFATEIGSFYLPKTEYRAKPESYWIQSNSNPSSFGYSNLLFYLALKTLVPVTHNFDLFLKFGVGINHYFYDGDWDYYFTHADVTYFGNWKRVGNNGVSPVFSIGGSYYFARHLYLHLQYMLFGSSWNGYHVHSQDQLEAHKGLGKNWFKNFGAVDLVTVGLGYAF